MNYTYVENGMLRKLFQLLSEWAKEQVRFSKDFIMSILYRGEGVGVQFAGKLRGN